MQTAAMHAQPSISHVPTLRLTGFRNAPHLDMLDLDALRVHLPVQRRKLAAGQALFRAGQPL